MNKIMMFTASWCSQCSVIKPMVQALDNHEIVNVEESPEVQMRYSVRGLPTVIAVDDNGDEIDRQVGLVSVRDLHKLRMQK